MKSKKMTKVNDNSTLNGNTLYSYVGDNVECLGLVVLVVRSSFTSIDVVIMHDCCEADYTVGDYFTGWGMLPGNWEVYKDTIILEND